MSDIREALETRCEWVPVEETELLELFIRYACFSLTEKVESLNVTLID